MNETRQQKIDRQRGHAADRAFDPIRAAIDRGDLVMTPSLAGEDGATQTKEEEEEAHVDELPWRVRVEGYLCAAFAEEAEAHAFAERYVSSEVLIPDSIPPPEDSARAPGGRPEEENAALELFTELELAMYGKVGNTWERSKAERVMAVLRKALSYSSASRAWREGVEPQPVDWLAVDFGPLLDTLATDHANILGSRVQFDDEAAAAIVEFLESAGRSSIASGEEL